MIDIESKCQEYAKNATPTYINGDFDRYAIAQSFEDGATWRINSAWHDVTELPERGHHVTVMFSEGGIAGCNLDVSQEEMLEAFKASGVVKWAYSEDLIPNKEGEK